MTLLLKSHTSRSRSIFVTFIKLVLDYYYFEKNVNFAYYLDCNDGTKAEKYDSETLQFFQHG